MEPLLDYESERPMEPTKEGCKVKILPKNLPEQFVSEWFSRSPIPHDYTQNHTIPICTWIWEQLGGDGRISRIRRCARQDRRTTTGPEWRWISGEEGARGGEGGWRRRDDGRPVTRASAARGRGSKGGGRRAGGTGGAARGAARGQIGRVETWRSLALEQFCRSILC